MTGAWATRLLLAGLILLALTGQVQAKGKAKPEPAPKDQPPVTSLEGILVDKLSGDSVAGAPVQLDRGPIAITDEKGRFVFAPVDPGAHEVWVQDPEHVPIQVTVQAAEGQRTELRYALDPAGKEEEEEVVVSTTRLTNEVSNTAVEVEEVKKIPGTQGDMGKIVQSLPGVARGLGFSTSTAGPGLVIQGAAPGDSKVFIDGDVVPLLYHFMGLTSVVNSDMLKSIDFMPSGFGAEFGEAIGGIVDATTRPCSKKGLGGYVNLSLIDAGLFVEGSIGDDLGFTVAARRSTVDTWLPYVLNTGIGLDITVAPVYYDYQAKLEWTPRPSDRLSLMAFGSSDEMKILMQKAISGDVTMIGAYQDQIQFHHVRLGWTHSPSKEFEIRSLLIFGYDQYHFQMGSARYIWANFDSLTGKVDAEWQIDEHWSTHFGGYVRLWYYHVDHSFPRPPKEGEIPSSFEQLPLLTGTENTQSLAGSLYAIGGYSPRQGTMFSLGLRLEGFGDPLDQAVIMPRLTASTEVRKGTTLAASVGLYYQPPAFDETSKSFGTPDLSMEQAWHFALRLKQELPDKFGVDFEVFYKILSSLVVPDPVKIYSNAGIGRISGIQVMVRREFKDNFFGWLAYTLMRSERKDGPDKPWRLFDYDQTHILTVLAGYKLPTGPVKPRHGYCSGWDFGARFQLVSGNPDTPLLGGIYDSDYDTYMPIAGEVNSTRLPLYHRLDLRVDYTWAWESWALSLYMDVQNVYNYRAIEGTEYNYDFSQKAYFQGLPVIPSLGIKGAF